MTPSRLFETVLLPLAVNSFVAAAPIPEPPCPAPNAVAGLPNVSYRNDQRLASFRLDVCGGPVTASVPFLRLDPVLGPFWEISLDFELTDAAARDRVRVTGIVRHVVSVPDHGDEGNGEPGAFSVVFELTDPVSLPQIQGFPAAKKHNLHFDNYMELTPIGVISRAEPLRTNQIGQWFFSVEGRHETTPIHEPGTAALLGLGALCIMFHTLRRRQPTQ